MSGLYIKSSPATSIHGVVSIPGDKSISHRAVILGAISQGITRVDNFLASDDCLATINAFQSMGVVIERLENKQVVIHGVGKYGLKKPDAVIDCGNSGTTMRLLAGLLAAQSFDSELTGDASLLKRPMVRISEPLESMGAHIQTREGKAPIIIKGNRALKAIHFTMPIASAQVKSCLLLAGLYAQGKTVITEFQPSRNHTELMLKNFGFPITQAGHSIEILSSGEGQAMPLSIPGDLSSAAFFIVAASLIPGSDILITQVGLNPTRTGMLKILSLMGADIAVLNQSNTGEEPVADLRVRYAPLQGITIPVDFVSLAIDEFPILFVAAACAKGKTFLSGATELRYKESDRISAMVKGLNQLGIDAQGLDDGVNIQGGLLQGGQVDSFGDHRIAMSFAIAGAVASNPVVIKNCASIMTSFPDFIAVANKLHLHIEEMIENAV